MWKELALCRQQIVSYKKPGSVSPGHKNTIMGLNEEKTHGNYILRDSMVCVCLTQTSDIQEFPPRMSKDQKKIVFYN